jgi:hypothetical protein
LLINPILISSENTLTVGKIRIRISIYSYRQKKPHKEKVLLDIFLVVDNKYNVDKY